MAPEIVPTAVVVDTSDGYTWAKDMWGKPFTVELATAFAAQRNDGRKPGTGRPYKVFLLAPAEVAAGR